MSRDIRSQQASESVHLDDFAQLVADTLHCGRERAKPLAALVHEKTGGNPFFAIQFLGALGEERLLAFHPRMVAWNWDLERIRAKGYTDNIADLMIDKLGRLPAVTREVLKHLACLGNNAEAATLSLVHGASEDQIHSALWDAVSGDSCCQYGSPVPSINSLLAKLRDVFLPDASFWRQ